MEHSLTACRGERYKLAKSVEMARREEPARVDVQKVCQAADLLR